MPQLAAKFEEALVLGELAKRLQVFGRQRGTEEPVSVIANALRLKTAKL